MANLKMLMFLLYSAFFVCTMSSKGSIPSYVPLCKRNDPQLNQCIINTFNEIRPYLVKGIPEMNIQQGEPLEYITAAATTGKQRALDLDIEGWNIATSGLTGAQIKNLTVGFDEPFFGITLTFPYIRFEGEYRFKGKIMLLEIDASDHFVINSTDIIANAVVFGKYRPKAEKNYIEFDKLELHLQIGNASVYFDNLVKDNPTLTETFNKALNDNIQFLVEDLKPIVEEVLGDVAKQYINAPFQAIPVDKLFPLD